MSPIRETPPHGAESPHTNRGIRTILSRIHAALAGIFPKDTPGPDTGLFVPEHINWELQGNGGTLSRDTLQSVLRTPGFEDISIALGLKMLRGTPLERRTLEALASSMRRREPHANRASILEDTLSELPEHTRVQATKICQIFRYGPRWFHAQCDRLAQELTRERTMPCLIAYSALLGLQSFMEHAQNGDHIVIVRSDPIGHDQHCGFVLEIGEDGCTAADILTDTNLLQLLMPGTSVVLVDDTIKNGHTTRRVGEAFARNANFPMLTGEARCMVRTGRE